MGAAFQTGHAGSISVARSATVSPFGTGTTAETWFIQIDSPARDFGSEPTAGPPLGGFGGFVVTRGEINGSYAALFTRSGLIVHMVKRFAK